MRVLVSLLLLLAHVVLAQQTSQPAASTPSAIQPASVAGCAQPASVSQVQQMMDLAGSKKTLEGFMTIFGQQMFETFKKMRPDIPPQIWDRLLARLKNPETLQGLLDAIVPIYQRHFCSDEIEEIIVFYQSPAGRKLSAEMPTIQKEAGEAGQDYFGHISEQIKQDVKEELEKQGTNLGTPPKAPDKDAPKQ